MGMLMMTLKMEEMLARMLSFRQLDLELLGHSNLLSLPSLLGQKGEVVTLEQEQLNKQLDQRALLPPYLHLPL